MSSTLEIPLQPQSRAIKRLIITETNPSTSKPITL
jgi:hypothetical protein